MTCRWLTALVAVAALLGICSVAHANSLSPYVWFWPGIVSVTFVYAFPASLLAAFVERPFLTAAGLKNRALVLSLRANFLSAVVGLLLIPVGYPALLVIGPLWCIIAFGLSCTVEIFYLRDFSRRLAWGWIVGGNAVSSIVLMTLPPIALVLKQNYYRLAWSLEPHEVWLNWSSLIASLTLFLTSFAWPIRRATACEATALGESDATAEVADQGQSIQT
jgi:hypothetical protein